MLSEMLPFRLLYHFSSASSTTTTGTVVNVVRTTEENIKHEAIAFIELKIASNSQHNEPAADTYSGWLRPSSIK